MFIRPYMSVQFWEEIGTLTITSNWALSLRVYFFTTVYVGLFSLYNHKVFVGDGVDIVYF